MSGWRSYNWRKWHPLKEDNTYMRWTHFMLAGKQRKPSTWFDRLLWLPFALERFDCIIHSFREGILILSAIPLKNDGEVWAILCNGSLSAVSWCPYMTNLVLEKEQKYKRLRIPLLWRRNLTGKIRQRCRFMKRFFTWSLWENISHFLLSFFICVKIIMYPEWKIPPHIFPSGWKIFPPSVNYLIFRLFTLKYRGRINLSAEHLW